MTTLQEILKRPQRIGDNLSSRQLFLLLDDLICRALEPLAATSPTFLEMTAEIVASSVIHRRRVSQETKVACFATFFGDPIDSCREMIKTGPDRGKLFAYLQRVSELGTRLDRAHVHVAKHSHSRIKHEFLVDLSECSRTLGRDRRTVPALRTSAFWYGKALDFRDQIVEKYIRLIYKGAVRESKKSLRRLDENDLFEAGYLAASRAVEKFNSSSGVLTSYMGLWLRGVPYDVSVQSVGVAFNTRSKNPKDVGWSTSLDKVPHVIDDYATVPHTDDGSNLMKKLAAVAFDPDIRTALAVSGVTPPVGQLAQSK